MADEIDFKQLEKLAENYANLLKQFDPFLRKFIVEMAERVIAKTKPRTPVGTPESTGIPGYSGGSLRGAWSLGEIMVGGGVVEAEILNGMDYATFVEYGHRTVGGAGIGWVEGRFMLTISMDEIQKQMPLRFQKAFAQWCKERGVG